MSQMNNQSHESFHFERGVNISRRPSVCTMVTALGNATNLDSHYILDGNGSMHGVTQYNNRIQHQQNLVRGVPVVPSLYYCGVDPSTSSAMSQSYQHFNASISSSAAPLNARHFENGVPTMPHCSSWSRPRESMIVNDHSHLTQGNYLGQHFQPVARPWSNQQLNNNNSDGHAVAWHQTLPMHFVQAPNVNGTSLENIMMGLPRYHDNAGSRSGHIFPHSPPINQQYHSFHRHTQCMQEIRGHSINFHPPLTAPSSHRVPANPPPPRSSSIFIGTRHVGHVPFAHARIYRPQRSNMGETTLRHRNLPPLAFFHLHDDIAVLDDHHSDMRLDIEDMSYEELLALGDRIGQVGTGLIEEMITSQMKTKTYILPTKATNLEETNCQEQEPDRCVICQDEYMNQDKIGILGCDHEYHADCLRKWLHEKNVCPICKAEALNPGEKCDKKQ